MHTTQYLSIEHLLVRGSRDEIEDRQAILVLRLNLQGNGGYFSS